MRPRLRSLGDDPVWAVWGAFAARQHLDFGALERPAPAAGAHLVLLVSPWHSPGPEAVAGACGLLRRGGRADVWLVCSAPSPGLQAAVLSAGGSGCLPRLPESTAVGRALQLCTGWPAPARAVVAPPPVRDPLVAPASAGPWWSWPTIPELCALATWPEPGSAAAALAQWRRARGVGPEALLWLGAVPAPLRGRADARLPRAARRPRVAVLSAGDWAGLASARTLVAGLQARGAPAVRVWVLGPTQAPLAQIEMALGVPCCRVSPSGGA